MEPRCLLSGTPSDILKALPLGTYGVSTPAGLEIGIAPSASNYTPQYVALDANPQLLNNGSLAPFATASPQGLTPSKVRHAYGVDQILFGSLVGDGSGQTIAIVDAYDYPTVVSDLHNFDVAFNLPDTTVKRVNQDGGSTLPPVDPAGKGDSWEVEEALDVQWAHAMAPKATILLVEADSPTNDNLIAHAVNYARSVPGVSVISMSFGIDGGFPSEGIYDSFFTTPAGHAPVTFLASTGDAGAPGGYPAESPNVLAVGGTTLNVDGSGNYISETGWSGSGGGLSLYESQPGYQVGTVSQSQSRRAIPDISFVADPATGVAIYDSYDFGSATPWFLVGGTSLSSPAWAGLLAIANQGRAASGLNPLGGTDSVQQHLYHLNSSFFHDITSGNNGFSAGPGYDLVTGIGSPRANLLIPQLDSVPSLVFTVQPTNVLPNHVISPAVTVALEDQFGTIDTNARSTVTLTVASGPGTLGGTVTVNLVGGVATFSDLTLSSAGNYTLSASDSAAGVSPVLSNVFTVLPPPTQIVFTTQPGTTTAGQVISGPVTVSLEDANGNVINDDAPVTLSVASGPGALSGTVTVNAVNGVATFDAAVLTKAGAYILAASDPLDALSGFTSNSFLVNAAAAATLAFEQPITGAIAGSPISPAVLVAIEDAYGNVISSSNANITIAVSSGPGLLAGSTSATTSSGVAAFNNLVLTTAGNYTLTATDAADNFIGTSNTFTLSPGAATNLAFLQAPSTLTAGQLFAPTTSAVLTDAFGNVATNNVSNVTIAVASGPGAILGTTTVPVVNGIANFNDITIKKAGTYQLVINDGGLGPVTSSAFNVNAGPPSQAVFLQQPSAITSGARFNLVMQIEDAAGNFIGNSNAPVHLSLVGAPRGAKLNAAPTTRAVNGIVTIHNAQLTPNTGYFTLGATLPGYVTSYSAPIIVSGPPVKLAIGRQPAAVVAAGHTLTPVVVRILDNFGRTAASNSPVTVSLIGPSGAVLGGTRTVHANNGVALFSNLSISRPGTYTLRFTAGKLQPVTSIRIVVTSSNAQLAAAAKKKQAAHAVAATTKTVAKAVTRTALLNPLRRFGLYH